MKSKTIIEMCLLLTVVLLGTGGITQAIDIEWVTQSGGDTWDAGWINLLESQGYTVHCQPAVYESLDETEIATLNSRDLIIVSRTLRAARYDDGTEPIDWAGLTAPMLCMDATVTDTSDWYWFDGGSNEYIGKMEVKVPSHPYFAGVQLDENNLVDIIAVGNVDIAAVTDAANGDLLATTEDGRVWMATWDTGVQFYPGSERNGTPIITGAPRVFFGAGLNLSDPPEGLNLNATGQLIFSNIVYDMTGATFDRKPIANAGSDAIVYLSDGAQLNGVGYDPEGGATIAWSQYVGPGTATFSDTGIGDPAVTFSAKGTYTLQISVDDGVNPAATDMVTIHVWDTADNSLVAHWDFESLPDPNTLIDVTGNGFDATWLRNDPNVLAPPVTAGILNDGTSQAWSANTDYFEVPTGNALTISDPNSSIIRHGNTIAAWIKMPSTEAPTNFPVIAAFDDANRMQLRNGVADMVGPGGNAEGSRIVLDDQWHHVVGVFDGPNATMKVYVDGLLDGVSSSTPGALFVNDPELRIGNRATDRLFYGLMDDLQIYNYALSDSEIAALTAEGDVPLLIDAGDDQFVHFKNQPVQLAGFALVDDGKPVATSYLWELTTYPLGADPNYITINNPTALDTTVTFPNPPVEGGYVFTLTGDDTVAPVSDTVLLTVVIPTCADVIADGLTSPFDVAGGAPDGEGNPTPDCRVDLQDLAVFAAQWLECVDPQDPSCTSPY